MIVNLYCYKNKLGNFFGSPFLDNRKPDEFVDAIRQAYFTMPVDQVKSYIEDELYCLGTFDNISGKVAYKKEFIFDVSVYVKEVIEKREVKKDDKPC